MWTEAAVAEHSEEAGAAGEVAGGAGGVHFS